MILDQFGREFSITSKPDQRPLAATPIRDSYREYVTAGLTPAKLAGIFRAADAGDMRQQAELFDTLTEKDGHILGESSKRINAVLDVPFEIQPASAASRDKQVADFVREQIERMADFDDVLTGLQDAVGKGYSAFDLGWEYSEGQAVPTSIEFIEQQCFTYAWPDGSTRRIPRLLTEDNPLGVELPAWRIMMHRYGGKTGNPRRAGIYRVCCWMYLFKNYAIKDWVTFAEIYGMPLRLGKYDSGASDDDKRALITAISALGSDAAGIISKSTEIEFVEGLKGTANSDLWERLAKFANAEMSKAILGQTLTAEVGEKGSYAASQTHNEVRLDLAKADTRAIAATIRNQLIRPLVGFNFGWDTPLPKYMAIWQENEDLLKKAQTYEILKRTGLVIGSNHVYETFGIPKPDKNEVVLGQAIEGAEPVTAKSGRKTPQIERNVAIRTHIAAKTQNGHSGHNGEKYGTTELLDELSDAAGAITDGQIDQIRDLVMQAKSFDEIRDGLLQIAANLDPSDLGALMQRALMAAELSGRYAEQEAR